MIHFGCPTCGKQLQVKDEFAGRQATCPQCAQTIQIPAAPPDRFQPESRGGISPAVPPQFTPEWHYQPSYPGDPVLAGASGPANTGMAVAGMVLGIVGLVFSFIPCLGWFLGIVLAVLGVIFSAIGLSQSGKSGQGKNMAVTGLILSILTIIWIPAYWFLIVSMFAKGVNDLGKELEERSRRERSAIQGPRLVAVQEMAERAEAAARLSGDTSVALAGPGDRLAEKLIYTVLHRG